MQCYGCKQPLVNVKGIGWVHQAPNPACLQQVKPEGKLYTWALALVTARATT